MIPEEGNHFQEEENDLWVKEQIFLPPENRNLEEGNHFQEDENDLWEQEQIFLPPENRNLEEGNHSQEDENVFPPLKKPETYGRK